MLVVDEVVDARVTVQLAGGSTTRGVIITRVAAFTAPHPIIVPNIEHHNHEKPQGERIGEVMAKREGTQKLREAVVSDYLNPLQKGKRIQRPPERS